MFADEVANMARVLLKITNELLRRIRAALRVVGFVPRTAGKMCKLQ